MQCKVYSETVPELMQWLSLLILMQCRPRAWTSQTRSIAFQPRPEKKNGNNSLNVLMTSCTLDDKIPKFVLSSEPD